MHFSRSPFIALAVSAMIGQLRVLRHGADAPGRFVAVHLGHHDVHQHDLDVGIGRQLVEGLLPVLGVDDLHLVLLEDGGDREQVARVVVDQQHLLAHQAGSVAVSRRSISRFGGRQLGLDAVQEQRGLVEQALRRAHVLDDDGLGQLAAAPVSSSRVSSLPV